MQHQLHIITASTRPGRKGPAVAEWIHGIAQAHAGFKTSLVDLAEFSLPVYDEPEHPRTGKYLHEHTRRWSASVSAADAFIFVTPEYNYGPPPSLLNALNFVYNEWNYKAAAFVSYGGMSGGMRAVEAIKQTLTTLKVVPVLEGVALPLFAQQLDENGRFQAKPIHEEAAGLMLNELHKWSGALSALRRPA